VSPFLLILVFILAFLICIKATPLAVEAGRRLGLVARPDGELRVHQDPVPYLGGLAVYGSFLLAYSLVFEFDQRILGLLLAGSIVVVLGLVDDFGQLRPGAKFLGQLIAVFVLVKSGIRIEWEVLPPAGQVALTFLWFVAMMNALNFLDVMDGLAAGVSFVAAVFLFVLAVRNGDILVATFTAALLGSLLAFLRFNFEPARIYLGDTGSMFLGLMLAALSILPSYSETNPLAVLNPLLILFVPCFEIAFTPLVRLLRRRNPFHGSPDHPSVRLREAGWPVRRIVLACYAAGVVGGAASLWNEAAGWNVSLGILVGAAVVSLLLAGWLWRVRPAA
jgi:UDP-GlcNAc:undecaprenyl-phosphate GlcNAc-1-phosphate transferase